MPRLPRCKVTTLSDGVTTEYYHDERLKELRDVDNPHARLDFDSVLLGTLAGVLRVEAVDEDAEARNAEAYARFEAAENRWDVMASGWCPKCNSAQDSVDEQYSFGVYAGIMCTACAIRSYADGCGHLDGRQGNAAELDEALDED
jgi:hypothetical protein